jgi:PEP-CTERM motif
MKLAFVAGFALLLATAEARATVYTLTGVSSISVSGTITTDGNTGTLSQADITSWQLNQPDTTFVTSLNPSNSTVSLTGNALTATATQLLFDFSDTTPSLLVFESPNFLGGSGGFSLQFCDGTSACQDGNLTTYHSSILLALIAPGLGNTQDSIAESGVTQIGAATAGGVPEPSTWAMMLLGFAGLGFAFRQSRRKVSMA